MIERATTDIDVIALVDRGVTSVHMQDLLSLVPSADELAKATDWVLTQDASADFPRSVLETTHHVALHTR